mmetsp:Transcript_7324/g.11263  ORF Transcript_7324/g.11263 Transcript_7324/m.11263 type:complete len:325 (-) Transcript_7324:277-1251(-)|eukprot:CAMPEP_0117046510 /NCGR_PEP_ID=MMETSP0472-20121206/32157_1 /TAXON_ID=693140 ORGANISM="Tiarina fusus, Strain LIS" /NCGR_SAMPLE_ID=MMETSP0472 /ASSEMBLY_ACC=CAM_ASM_000603 /LENGTH=324 /DNA_ID=CAMNT_0004758885 /DNA_START=58 /DNA_END=1032 /DNA_ORIENTATION=+
MADSDSDQRPTDAELKTVIRRLIPKVNLQKTGVKAFTKLLSKECGGLDLKHRSSFIKDALSEAINEIESSEEESSDDDESENEGKKKAKRKGPGRGKGLSVKKEISKDLAKFLGEGNEMARTDIVKKLWEYIKENDLQNPDNKREILLDKKLKAVFGVDNFTMFTMNKYIAAHIHPFKPVDLTPKVKTTPTKKRKRKDKDPPQKKKRKPKKPGLQPPYRLSEAMQSIVGTTILPRPQVVTALWAYIKKNDLQNPEDKREIICDQKLKAIMDGQKTVTMFNMNRYITNHLLEKLDRSAYTHEDDDAVEAAEVDDEEEDSDDARAV